MKKEFPYETFEEYKLIIKETEQEFFIDAPECRYEAHLEEMPIASLHEYGATQEDAAENLKAQFYWLKQDIESRKSLRGLTPLGKIIYKIGGMDTDGDKFRVFHPFTWVIVFPSIIIIYLSKVFGYIASEFVKIIKESRDNLTWW